MLYNIIQQRAIKNVKFYTLLCMDCVNFILDTSDSVEFRSPLHFKDAFVIR
jgi:hypothetical protein